MDAVFNFKVGGKKIISLLKICIGLSIKFLKKTRTKPQIDFAYDRKMDFNSV